MARGWRVIDVSSGPGALRGKRGTIVFNPREGPERTVPAEDLAVIIAGPNTSITSGLLHYLAKHDVAFLVADWRGVPYLSLNPWGGHSRVAARQIAQANLSEPRRKNAWMRIVEAKIRGQHENLKLLGREGAPMLRTYANSVRSGDPENVEGTAARHYWQRLFPESQEFSRDPDRPDFYNSALNYGYMVLRGYGVRAATSAGLATSLGIFHSSRSNFFNLVDDLIEPFRPAIDYVVAGLEPDSQMSDAAVKGALVAAASQVFSPDGSRIPSVFESLAQQYGRYVQGDVARLRVPYWQGPQLQEVENLRGEE